jgi:two-component system response regulator GlrR
MGRVSILVVDDEPCIRDICTQFLRMAGYEVDAMESAEEALAAVARHPYDLLILDLRLQGMDGLTTFQRLKAISPETKAVVVSGSLEQFESELSGALENGLMGVLAKPFTLQDLSELVDSAVHGRKCAA